MLRACARSPASPQERRGLAKVHRGQPDGYLHMKEERRELTVFAGEQPGMDAERAAIERWGRATDEFGPEEAVMVCRENQRRERLNQLAREHLKRVGELGEGVVIAGREWCVGDRVIARRNDRRLDVDNGTRGTIQAVDATTGLSVRTDADRTVRIDPEYASGHLEHAYALTGHGMQGGTVEWAAVVGGPGDFTRNWSYTALSRARQPTEILLIDEPTPASAERDAIAPNSPGRERGPLQRMALRMRERDGEDLAIEQLPEPPDRASPLNPHAYPARAPDAIGRSKSRTGSAPQRWVSELRPQIRQLDRELADVVSALDDPAIRDARAVVELRGRIGRVQAAAQREPGGRRWRDREGRRNSQADAERRLFELGREEAQLLERVPNPEELLEKAAKLRERQADLIVRAGDLTKAAIEAELGSDPPWLAATLGSEPEDRALRGRWQRTAREIASHRIRHDVTDSLQTGISDSDHVLRQSIGDTRRALGLDAPDRGLGYDAGY